MLVVVMIYGRTRALPQQVDYALTLAIEIPPSDKSPLQHRSRGVSGGFFTAAAVNRSPVELLLNPGGERDARSDELDSTRARVDRLPPRTTAHSFSSFISCNQPCVTRQSSSRKKRHID